MAERNESFRRSVSLSPASGRSYLFEWTGGGRPAHNKLTTLTSTYCSTSATLMQSNYGARKPENTTMAITSANAVSFTVTFTDTIHGGGAVTHRSAAGGLQ